MRASAYLCLGLAVAVGGCTFKNSCKKSTVLVTATFDGTARTADELDVIVQIDQGSTITKQLAGAGGSASGSIEVDFPNGYPTGSTLTVSVSARLGGVIVADGSGSITLSSGCTTLALAVVGAGGGGDDLSMGDLAGSAGCVDGDGVCGNGCNNTTDHDCAPVCGNNVVETGEVCDDGNTDNGDKCDPTCQWTNTATIAAGVADGYGRADGVGRYARLGGPSGYSFHATGITTDQVATYFGDSCAVRRYDRITGAVTTIAGTDGDCSSSTDGIGPAARFSDVVDLEFVPNASKGVIYTTGETAVRKIDLATMMVTTLNGVPGIGNGSGDGDGIGASSDGTTLYLVDRLNGLRSVNLSNNSSTLIADFSKIGACSDVAPYGGDLYLACGYIVQKVTPGATPTIVTYAGNTTSGSCVESFTSPTAARLGNVNRLIIDSLGNITASDEGCHVVWTIASNFARVDAGTLNMSGHDDTASGIKGTFNGPTGVASLAGDVYVVDTGNRELRLIIGSSIATIAGVTGKDITAPNVVGASPRFNNPYGIIANGDTPFIGTFTFGSGMDETIKLDVTNGSASVFNTKPLMAGVVVGAYLYSSSPNNDNTIWKYPLDGSAPSIFAGVPNTMNMAAMDGTLGSAVFRASGFMTTDGTNIFLTDAAGTLIREIDLVKKMVVTLAGVDGSTDVVDGTGTAAHFGGAGGLACDGSNLYITDGLSSSAGSIIRALALSTNKVTTLAGKADELGAVDGIGSAARFAGLKGLATDGHAIFACDPGDGPFSGGTGSGDPNGPTIREIELPSGRVTTMIGARRQWTARPGVGWAAAVNTPFIIAFDPTSHALLFTDPAEDVIWKVQ